ncbi:helix-turn-helix domain-containing protein [Streptomyces scabiei]|uniref:helix-turn-helix domain-containing protein n=1 Tax=Streptomyces scabiei TaxID=1930 RepID=UPI001B3204F5|nr:MULTISPECIES: helix-turn-helix domain-containing protein [Streptomyces]MBP5915894.1 helix-turn-helix domain-containing protein [Streptomyces sp. LBUM 1486]MDX2629177.1 helix-turn-helix domain-containing protein [Streptomyces scabiei]MDX3030255.1 helix-turn-helix domain-containing protein [Streptomyces scabiei]MDX3168256.1 helix-turn-helix domain-containing protein [Streptomyces scabiei]MDX3207800.1 helix-turn-helix domain-containing protein [Streptomyces scabiei]
MTKPAAVRRKTLTVAEALALPVMFDVWPTVGQALDIGRTATYQLARENALPIPCIRVGRQLRARRSDLLNFLGLSGEIGTSPEYQPGESAGNDEAARVPAGPPQSSKSTPTAK